MLEYKSSSAQEMEARRMICAIAVHVSI
jgi:hypothetical protein